uniref:Metal tolerance protein 3 n=1 Tax=Talaromyces marneffei PM1 TaxID=1077442 RepID=A0A093UQU6_TALMA
MDDSSLRHSISLHPHPFNLSREDIRLSARTPSAVLPSDEAVVSAVKGITDTENIPSDAERNSLRRYTSTNDPLQLASKLKTEEEIKQIRANTSRKRDRVTPSFIGDRLGITSSGKLQEFYQVQNENIERFLTPVEEHVRAAKEFNSSNQLKYKIAVWGSFAANVVLSIVQVYAAISSGSLSLFTTMADAIFDPMSNITLLLSNKAVTRVDPRKFPAGKARIETAGNICFCFLMTAVSFLIIAFSIKQLSDGSTEQTTSLHLPSVIAVIAAFCTKLSLFLYCWALRNQYSQVRILWEDHRNDLLVNGFGILTSVGGNTQMQQLITYISMTHSPAITAIDTVRAYTSGPRLVVEVDVVMDRNATLMATHDVAEELQIKLESLPGVERAYVHVDYETTHKPEHFLKKEL